MRRAIAARSLAALLLTTAFVAGCAPAEAGPVEVTYYYLPG